MDKSFKKIKDTPVIELLEEVVNDLRSYFYKKVSADYGNYSKIVNSKNPLYLLFRKLTNQKIRNKIFNLIGKVKNNNDDFFGEFEAEIFLAIKFLSLDFFYYCFLKQPKIPLSLFAAEDSFEMKNFLKKFFYLALNGRIPKKLFTKNELLLYEKRVGLMDKIKMKNGYFELSGFKSIIPFFENFNKPTSYKVSEKKIDTVFDLGAFLGDTAYIFYKFLKAKKIYAFEPDPDNFKILKENIKLNNLQDVIFPLEIGVGKEKGFFYLEKSGGASSITNNHSKSKNKVKVKVVSIDDFVADNNIKKVDFIKMDIEGAEFDALKGAVKTLKRDKPDLLIAIYHKGEHFFEIPGWLKKQVPEYNLRFVAMNGASPIIERYIAASVRRI